MRDGTGMPADKKDISRSTPDRLNLARLPVLQYAITVFPMTFVGTDLSAVTILGHGISNYVCEDASSNLRPSD
jgi:hypothetical protein